MLKKVHGFIGLKNQIQCMCTECIRYNDDKMKKMCIFAVEAFVASWIEIGNWRKSCSKSNESRPS